MKSYNCRQGFIDFCKFLLSIMIVLGHYSYYFCQEYVLPPPPHILSYCRKLFEMILVMFFALSGFYSYKNLRKDSNEFIWKRIISLFPLYMLSVVCFCMIGIIYLIRNGHFFAGRMFNFELFIYTFLGINSLIGAPLNINGPCWFVQVLLFCSLILYILFLLEKHFGCKLYIIPFFVGILCLKEKCSIPFFSYHFCLGYIAFFGGICFNLINETRTTKKMYDFVVIAALCFVLLSIFCHENFLGSSIIFSIFIIFPLLIYISNISILNSFFNKRIFIICGKISYSIYLFHIPCFILCGCIFGNINYMNPNIIISVLAFIILLSIFITFLKDKMIKLFIQK